jgi:acyl-CoA dehydrogenase
MAPHPLATLVFDGCRVPAGALLGEVNGGFKLAMQTLDIFRASVAAAALGMARRALAEAVDWARKRRMFGQTLADFQLTQARIGEMAALIDAGALLTYRAAWMRDLGAGSARERSVAAAAAKMTATENAQKVIDMALQMHGGRGCGSRCQGGKPVPRHPFAAHLRGRHRGAAAHHRQSRSAGVVP